MKTLYGIKDKNLNGLFYFGIKPYEEKYQSDYDSLDREISLKEDLNWEEVKDLQNLLRKSDIWTNFPLDNITLIDAEFKIAEQEQRLDLLYLQSDGLLVPFELKIAGTSTNTHGQLIRYISDLYSIRNSIDLDYVKNKAEQFADKFLSDTTIKEHKQKTEEFITAHKINTISVKPNKGFIIDTNFKPQLAKAINHLNDHCSFDLNSIKISTKVDQNWSPMMDEYFFKIEFQQI